MAPSLIAEYTYTSQLPLMLHKISSRTSSSHTGLLHSHDRNSSGMVSSGMNSMQTKLWDLVWHMKEKVNVDPEYSTAHAAIRQFTLERWVWRTYWPENEFPGVYPQRIDPVVIQRGTDGNFKISTTPPSLARWSAAHPPPAVRLQPSFLTDFDMGPPPPPYTETAPKIKLESGPALLPRPSFSGNINFSSGQPMPFGHQQAHPKLQVGHNMRPNFHVGGGEELNFKKPTRPDAYNTPEAYTISRPGFGSHPIPLPLLAPCPSLHPPFAATSHPLELNLSPESIQQIINNIMRFKHIHYVPTHGWDPLTRLPRYAVLNLASDAYLQFFGGKGGDGRFERVRAEFGEVRIMFQRLDRGAVIVWAEGKERGVCVGMATGGGEWRVFVKVWAFLRTWAERGNATGKSENIVDHLINCRDIWENLDTSSLVPPPAPKGGMAMGAMDAGWKIWTGGDPGVKLDNDGMAAGMGHFNENANGNASRNESRKIGSGDRSHGGDNENKPMVVEEEKYEDRDHPGVEVKREHMEYED